MNGHFPKLTSVSRIREAASQLFNAEQTLYSVIEYAPIVLFALDPEGKFSVCEGQGLENIQVSPGALTGSSVYEEYKDCLWLTDTVRRSLSGQSSSGLGKIHDRWFEFHCLPVTEEGINLGTICVGLDVTERKNAEDELRQSEERFRTLTQATFEGVIIHEKGKILMANPACEKIFGYSPEELVGQSVLMLAAGSDKGTVEQISRSTTKVNYEGTARHRNGTTFDAEVRSSILPWQGREIRVATVRDISEQKAAERIDRFYLEAQSTLSDSMDFDRVLQALAQVAVPFLADFAIVDRINKLGNPEDFTVWHRDPAKLDTVRKYRTLCAQLAQPCNHTVKVAKSKEAELFPDLSSASEKEVRQIPGAWTLYEMLHPVSHIALPLVAHDRCIAVIHLLSDRPDRVYGIRELRIAREFGRRAALTLEKSELYSEMRKARDLSSALARREKFLSEASALLAGTLDFEQTMKAIVQIPIGSMADYCALDLLSDHGNSIEKVTSSTSFTIPREKLTRLESGDPVWNVIRSGKPQLSGPVPDYQLASVLIVPLRTQGHTIGALSLGSSSRAFDATDVEFGEKLALRVANALENSRLYRESTRAIRMREDLIAVVSHDLKNPLLSILMNAEMLLKTIEEPRDKKHLELIWTSAEQMKRLVLRILDLAKLEVGRTTLELRNLKIDEALQEAIGSIDAMVSERKPRIQLHLHDPAAEVRCDRERLVQILSNLLSNAVKFSPPGGTIRIRTRAEGDLILFSIQDQGPGIPPDQIPHIFDQYWQARGHRKLGTGLGLAIARGAVEAHGGHIWVESEPGKGATFHFTLKKAEASSAGGAAAAA